MTELKTIFITGAAGGMGSSTAKLFKEKGWFIGCYDINKENLENLEKELGNNNIIYEQLDVTDKDQFEKCLNSFSLKTKNKLDILFNNAGGH